MKKTLKQIVANGRHYNLLALPGTHLFQFEIVNKLGSNIERIYEQLYSKNVYGISHLIEHLSFRATQDYTTDELMKILKTEGTYNASTSHDRINYWFRTVSESSDLAIKIVCNYALNDLSRISPEEFETEKNVVFNEAKRYADDDQTMFYFNTIPALCGYHKEDNVIGLPSTVATLTLEDAITIKNVFLTSTTENVFNVTYDSNDLSEEQIINSIESQLQRFSVPDSVNPQLYTLYHDSCKLPRLGTHSISNESEQFMTYMTFPIIENKLIADFGNLYLDDISDTSFTDVIREKKGLTYGITLYSPMISYIPYTAFGCDVSKGTEEILREAFEFSLNSSVDNYSEENHAQLLKTHRLQSTMAYVNQLNYTGLFFKLIWNSHVFSPFVEEMSHDLDNSLDLLRNTYYTYENVSSYLRTFKNYYNKGLFSTLTNEG